MFCTARTLHRWRSRYLPGTALTANRSQRLTVTRGCAGNSSEGDDDVGEPFARLLSECASDDEGSDSEGGDSVDGDGSVVPGGQPTAKWGPH
jgi:hypothetical protein